ncbi:Uncharacterized protein ChrSV_2191 [Chromobacterium vaccinii]|nr:Uncharacterized protein ChrSW_2191 [Chromobacterium vaccinii]QND89649.1 Uncharacterized protein ChrSV_2191 [Chromobacterium vaccinii]
MLIFLIHCVSNVMRIKSGKIFSHFAKLSPQTQDKTVMSIS